MGVGLIALLRVCRSVPLHLIAEGNPRGGAQARHIVRLTSLFGIDDLHVLWPHSLKLGNRGGACRFGIKATPLAGYGPRHKTAVLVSALPLSSAGGKPPEQCAAFRLCQSVTQLLGNNIFI